MPKQSDSSSPVATAGARAETLVRLDLNNPGFQANLLNLLNLLNLQRPERHAALDTLNKIRQLTWNQLYRDNGLKWEKIASVKPPARIDAIYSLRITQSRRATAYREDEFIRFLTVAADHDGVTARSSEMKSGIWAPTWTWHSFRIGTQKQN